MELKHVKNMTDESAEMLIYGGIGTDENGRGIDGAYFAQEVAYLVRSGFKDLTVRINSGGGSVFEGFAICAALFSAMMRGINVTTINDGVAGSMAGIIMMFGQKRKSLDYARMMIHAPSGGDEQVREQFTQMLGTILKGQTVDASIDDIMSGELGDVWLTAQAAQKKGYIDEIISTDRSALTFENVPIQAVVAQAASRLDKPEPPIMDKIAQIRAALGLEESANVEAAVRQLKEKAGKVEGLEKDLADTKAELKVANDKLGDINKKAALDLVENAIKAGKFDESQKDTIVAMAEKDLDAFRTLVKATKAYPQKTVTAQLGGGGAAPQNNGQYSVNASGIVTGPGLGDGGTIRELDKQGKSEIVAKAAPEVYAKAYEYEYGVSPN